jgi:hypothetical protein
MGRFPKPALVTMAAPQKRGAKKAAGKTPPRKPARAGRARGVASRPVAAKSSPKTTKSPAKPAPKAKPAGRSKPETRDRSKTTQVRGDFEGERPTLISPSLEAKPKKPRVTSAGGISTDAVQRRTGKSWDDWFAILDGAGARELDHKGVVAILAQRHGVGPWWQQMVAVAYEQFRGTREKHQTESGYQVSASKTMNVPLARLYRMWNDSEQRASWLSDERFQIKAASNGKSIRARWGRGTSHVDVYFQDRGADKSAVSVNHARIENRSAAEQMKAYWAKKLDALEKALA